MSGANLWRVYSAAVPTTAPMAYAATGTSTKTFLQLTPGTGDDFTIVGWGVAFDAAPTAYVRAELINTTTVAGGTPTAVTPTNMRGTTATTATAGFLPASEGTVVATTRVFDQSSLLTNYFYREYSLGREPIIESSQVLRIRLTTATTINALCWLDFQ